MILGDPIGVSAESAGRFSRLALSWPGPRGPRRTPTVRLRAATPLFRAMHQKSPRPRKGSCGFDEVTWVTNRLSIHVWDSRFLQASVIAGVFRPGSGYSSLAQEFQAASLLHNFHIYELLRKTELLEYSAKYCSLFVRRIVAKYIVASHFFEVVFCSG